MELLPITTSLLQPGDNLAERLCKSAAMRSGDIIVVSSKALATTEDRFIRLEMMRPSEEAMQWHKKTGRSAAFCEAVLQELKKQNGTIIGACPGALLTELRPEGLKRGTLLIANAGLDESNAPAGMAIGWPEDCAASTTMLRHSLEQKIGGKLGVILTDSCCHPRRLGVTAFALTVSGLNPLVSQVGREDLFGKKLGITTEAVADQLATAANFLMGNAEQATPAVIMRDHGLVLSEFEGWVEGIGREEDLFGGMM